ncbi:MAG: cytochrome P450 [Actinomycetota bacterium]|nr:cytochrome P450 [Actinomycetota bacterium]
MGAFAESLTVEALDADPYGAYRRLRSEEPVAWVPAVNLWLVTRAADVEYVTTHPEEFSATVDGSPLDLSFGGPSILTVDGESHLDKRRSLDRKYRPRTVAGYIDALVQPIADACLARLLARPGRRAELMAEYFEPISVLSLGAVLGLGHLPASTLQEWFHGLAMGATNFERDPTKQAENDRTAAAIDAALRPLMERLRHEPDDSTIAHMLTTGREPGSPRPVDEVMPSLKVIILGGMQEPGHGAGSCLVGLLQDPAQLDLVRREPERWDDAVHEGLRWVAPIGTQTRQAVSDTALGGTLIPAGAPVGAVVASACRDEAAWPDPDRFDIRRERRAHAAFGYGPHFCAGHAFARDQERIALRTLVDALPGLALDQGHDVVMRGWEFRAPTSLHVTW